MAPKNEFIPGIERPSGKTKEEIEIDPLIDELADLILKIHEKPGNPSGTISEIGTAASRSQEKIKEIKNIIGSKGKLWEALDVLDNLLGQMFDGNEAVVPSRLPFLVGALKNKCGDLMKFKRGSGVT